ncbi:MAG: hypothetical protein AVDCRST_MAG68-3568 [uncultured Gemmatimonadetes bacterium]|uniref:DUF4276 family protein n=1 Tax=uncultured Gemmatimonadota bacterium TaxID=203437 RepID=A0A6J4M563_9BACT|nr:MAG: hypothetical protein AVDCRST_MAG68-3568 [uncultured Gemmatimonadota bacterium]
MGAQRQPLVELFVEGEYEAEFLTHLLPRAELDLSRFRIRASGGKEAIRRELHARASEDAALCVALVDADERNVPDAREHARHALGNPRAEVFCAVPAIEAWLFADADALRAYVGARGSRDMIDRLPLPEEIPFPREVASRLFEDDRASFGVVDRMDVAKASARSPSLHVFLKGLGRIVGRHPALLDDVHARSMERDVFSNLVAEISPATTVIYRTVDGTTFTAEQMIRHIREGTSTGRQYASDLLRVSRDFLTRQAQREARR